MAEYKMHLATIVSIVSCIVQKSIAIKALLYYYTYYINDKVKVIFNNILSNKQYSSIVISL